MAAQYVTIHRGCAPVENNHSTTAINRRHDGRTTAGHRRFGGVINPLLADSTPVTPSITYPPFGAPNVVVVLLDDVGFGAASTFGGPVPTPALDRVAGAGLRYNQFHTTALCSPTRAALLTGRNHHSAHMGTICEIAYGFPGYDSVIPQSTATVAQILRMNGYSTALFGKAHFTPTWEIGPAGPFDRWPTGLGFERFYGFLGGDTSQYEPALYDQTTPIEPYVGRDDYHLTEDLADRQSSGSGCRRRRHPTSRSSFTSRRARRTAHIRCGRSGRIGSPANSMTAGMRCGNGYTPARSRWASFLRAPGSRRDRSRYPPGRTTTTATSR